MKAATIVEIKQELLNSTPAKVTELCLRLARFKKENKELLTYLLFEAHDITTYITSIKIEIDSQFEGINKTNIYFVKKTLRKILRICNKYIRYCGIAEVEIETLLHFCSKVKTLGYYTTSNNVINNIYTNQLKKITKSIGTLHEDLQYDYLKAVEQLG